MARGKAAEVGKENTAPNGYRYVKTKDGWRLKHHVVAEQKLGRKLKPNEMVRFADKDRTNFKPSNIKVVEKGNGSLRRRKAVLESRIEELRAELADVKEQLNSNLK